MEKISETNWRNYLMNSLQVMKELVNRDKNRPSVIAWSIANEPVSEVPEATNYFLQGISSPS